VAQWQRLGQTGDAAVNKYTPIRAGSVSAFGQQLNAFADTFAQTVGPFAHDQPISRPDLGETKKTTGTTNMTTALVNEMFRAQAELLGARQNAAAPGFFRGWTSDHDLGNPRIRALNVQVFLTRNQLNGLAQSLKLIVDTAKQSALSPQDFFDNLQLLSARTAADPERPAGTGEVRTIRASNLLPSFLKLLPYKTKILYMTRDDWLSGGVSGQQEFIDDLDYKLQQYQDIYNEPRRWTALDPKDPGNAICPVPLDVLP
jgi:hypothetical protein